MSVTYDVSSDGRHIVFTGGSDGGRRLYDLDLTNYQVTPLTRSKADESHPAFGPGDDGIVFSRKRSGRGANREIIWFRVADGHEVRLTDGRHRDFYPRCSADGAAVVFIRYREADERPDRAAGWDVFQLDRTTLAIKRLTDCVYLDAGSTGFVGDTRTVVYDATVRDRHHSADLWLVDPGAEPRRLSRDGRSWQPSVGADGRHIAYSSAGGRKKPQIWLAALADGRGHRLTDGRSALERPRLNVATARIYYLRRERRGPELWRMAMDGTSPERLAGPDLFVAPERWRPGR
ncbi:MAG: PD40 domain-containing protein [Armatimonadetes bacterium]|nr:PD40 domain-containing protein [Armatimonadota bacterium]